MQRVQSIYLDGSIQKLPLFTVREIAKVVTIIAKDNFLQPSKLDMIQRIISINPNLRRFKLVHDCMTCACELGIFLEPLLTYLQELEDEIKERLTFEIFVQAGMKYKKIMKSMLRDLEGSQIEDQGSSLRVDLLEKYNFRVLIQFVDLVTVRRDIFRN